MQGLTGSVGVCAALQGGQFMFTNILMGYASGKGKQQTAALFRGRLYFFAFLVVSPQPCLLNTNAIAPDLPPGMSYS